MLSKILLLLLLPITILSQNKFLNTDAYQSLYSDKYNQPLMVKYKLYKGGGECSRQSFRFKDDKYTNVSESDYAKSGYDMGHMCNAEDMAYDCVKEESTFRFYNCCPQMTKLNRGVWKHWETKIRELSQTDSLVIICGPLFLSTETEYIKSDSKVVLPSHFYKIVYSQTSKKIIMCMLFNNKGLITKKDITISYLKSIIDKDVINYLKLN